MSNRGSGSTDSRTSKFFKHGSICIYFDQDSSSNLANKNFTDETWSELRELIWFLFEQNKIIVPLSLEHFLETSKREECNALTHDATIRKLSKTYTLRNEFELAAAQLNARVRNRRLRREDCFLRGSIRPMQHRRARRQALQLNKTYQQIIEEINILPNIVKDAGRHQRKPSMKEQEKLLSIRLEEHSNELQSKFREMEHGFDALRLHYQAAGESIPRWSDVLGRILMRRHRFSSKDARRAGELIQTGGGLKQFLPY